MKRTLVVLSMVVGLITVSVTIGGAAWGVTNTPPTMGHPGTSAGWTGGGTPPVTTTGQHPCGCTTTTTVPPTTTTTTAPAPTTTTVVPVVPAPISGPVNPAPDVVPAAPVAVVAPTQLPFTGVPTKPMLMIGMALVALGLLLASSRESWGRTRRRLTAMVLGFLPRFAPVW
ncbi:MAG TPA: hypothetical protein VHW93_04130 [Acidimicrobiales bacterium]|nr:hypothetical protein [Acidimicrobiales bacterium]